MSIFKALNRNGRKAGVFAMLSAICMLLLLAGCQGPMGPGQDASAEASEAGTGTLALTIGTPASMARTILPDGILVEPFAGFAYMLAPLVSDPVPTNGDNDNGVIYGFWDLADGPFARDLPTGEWTLTITAYIACDLDDFVRVTEPFVKEITIAANAVTNVDVEFEPLPEGYGVFAWHIYGYEDDAEVEIVIFEFMGMDNGTPDFDNEVYFDETEYYAILAAGSYVVIVLVDGDEVYLRALQIFRNMVSSLELNVGAPVDPPPPPPPPACDCDPATLPCDDCECYDDGCEAACACVPAVTPGPDCDCDPAVQPCVDCECEDADGYCTDCDCEPAGITIPNLGVGAANAIDFTTLGTGSITVADFNAVVGIGVSGRDGDEAGMTLAVSPAGLAVSGRTDNHNAVRIDLAALGLDAATTYTVRVAGTWEPAANEPIIGLVLGGDTGNPGAGHGADSFSTNETTFSVWVNVLGNVPDALVMTRSWGDNRTTPFTITSISVEELVAAPAITTTTLPGGFVGTAYSQTLVATGSTPITWVLYSGDLPGGLTLSGAGVISGTPAAAGTFNFVVEATNPQGDDTQALTIVIATPVVIPTAPVTIPLDSAGLLSANAGATWTFAVSETEASATGRGANYHGIVINFPAILAASSAYTGGLVTVNFTVGAAVGQAGMYNTDVGAVPGLGIGANVRIGSPTPNVPLSVTFALPNPEAASGMLATNTWAPYAGSFPDITITSITLGPLPADG